MKILFIKFFDRFFKNLFIGQINPIEMNNKFLTELMNQSTIDISDALKETFNHVHDNAKCAHSKSKDKSPISKVFKGFIMQLCEYCNSLSKGESTIHIVGVKMFMVEISGQKIQSSSATRIVKQLIEEYPTIHFNSGNTTKFKCIKNLILFSFKEVSDVVIKLKKDNLITKFMNPNPQKTPKEIAKEKKMKSLRELSNKINLIYSNSIK